jgi:hypothetical protein
MVAPPQMKNLTVAAACSVVFFIFSIILPPTSFSAEQFLRKAKNSFEISNFTEASPQAKPNSLPKNWKLRVWRGKPDVKILNKDGKGFLRLRSQKASVSVYRNFKLDLRNFPTLKWRWKVTQLPKNADARIMNRDDQAAGIYVVFPRFPSMINSRFLAYIWETSAPEGTVMRNRKNPMIHYVVVRSGKGKLNQWITEERNVLDDYRKVFKQEPPMVGGVALLIDTDDTRSQAESFFAQIEFKRPASGRMEPPPNRFVKRLLYPFALPE